MSLISSSVDSVRMHSWTLYYWIILKLFFHFVRLNCIVQGQETVEQAVLYSSGAGQYNKLYCKVQRQDITIEILDWSGFLNVQKNKYPE